MLNYKRVSLGAVLVLLSLFLCAAHASFESASKSWSDDTRLYDVLISAEVLPGQNRPVTLRVKAGDSASITFDIDERQYRYQVEVIELGDSLVYERVERFPVLIRVGLEEKAGQAWKKHVESGASVYAPNAVYLAAQSMLSDEKLDLYVDIFDVHSIQKDSK